VDREAVRRRCEGLLEGFEPSFEFEPIDPITPEELADRLRRLRHEAAARDCDALLLHSDQVGWYHTSNSLLRYTCDWAREGLLIIPTDADLPPTLLTFFGSGVMLPPPGEPTWVDDVRQVGGWGREVYARPGQVGAKVCEAATSVLADELGLAAGALGTLGDATSRPYWEALAASLPRASLVDQTDVVLRMQRIRSPHEQALVRAAAQLIDIGVQAAQHVTRPGVTDHEIYAAFTFAQLARGGETGDGYQVGVNPHGTHVGKPYGHVVRDGDVVSLYISHVTYRGYDAQAARMILVGRTSAEQEEVIAMCMDAYERALSVARPGLPIGALNDAAFGAFVDRGRLTSTDSRSMPYNLAARPDGTALPFERRRVPAPDWEAQGRTLRHVYPATSGPFGPSLGHSVEMAGMRGYTLTSANEDRLEPGMTMVIHPQWLEPLTAGCNIGNCVLITEDGAENLNCHTELEPFRVPA
jgi:Xaa-Pro aminopeptidase